MKFKMSAVKSMREGRILDTTIEVDDGTIRVVTDNDDSTRTVHSIFLDEMDTTQLLDLSSYIMAMAHWNSELPHYAMAELLNNMHTECHRSYCHIFMQLGMMQRNADGHMELKHYNGKISLQSVIQRYNERHADLQHP